MCGKPRGTTDNPIVAGLNTGDAPVLAKLLQNIGSNAYGEKIWITGKSIPQWVNLQVITLNFSYEEGGITNQVVEGVVQ